MALQKNRIIPLTITALSHEGAGIGRSGDGAVVFVPMAAPGDRLTVRIVKVLRNRAYGIVESIVEPSPVRVENDCPYYHVCGGCTLRHISPEAELAVKDDFVRQNLRRIGKLNPAFDAPVDSPAYARYRNKAAYPVAARDGRVVCGFYAPRSHRLVPVEDCLLQPALFAGITARIRRFCEEHAVPPYDEAMHTGLLRHIVLRYAEMTGEVMAVLVINGKTFPQAERLAEELHRACPAVTTLLLDQNSRKTNVIGGGEYTVLFGHGFLTDELCGVRVRLSPGSFYQVNRAAAGLLYRKALEYADPSPGDLLLDLYCGTGTIGLSMASRVRGLIGVETVPQAVADAKRNAAGNGIQNARFLCMDAGEAAGQLRREGLEPDIVLLDPPRAGLEAAAARQLRALNPRRIVYISCNSATLARDAALLAENGYRALRCRAVNLFPRTAHTEAILLLEKESDL